MALVGQRINNMQNRGLIRFIFEEKHSPGFMYYFVQSLNEYGLSSLDRNAGLFALPSELTEAGLSLQLCSYSQPGLPSPGAYLEVTWPDEFKEPSSQYYSDYCSNSGVILAVLREFGLKVDLLATTGNLHIDMTNFDPRYSPIVKLYADALMRSADGYSDRRYQLPQPIHFPKLRLPAQLQPWEQPGLLLAPNMSAR